MKFLEVEFKYSADKISLKKFIDFCEAKEPSVSFRTSGFDDFYENTKNPESFCRHRVGEDFNQLTFKRKTVEANNYIRTEHNIDLLPTISKPQVSAFLDEFGYKYNTSIWKNCFIYKYETYTLVYYIIYNEELEELGRFLEIEVAEDYPWQNEDEAWNQLILLEKLCKDIGISAQARIKNSLFEMFKK